jgi:HEPN domain-containing protein
MDFDIKKTIQYWLEGADYDFGVADAMFQTGKYPYALFMGHLAVEKLLKAIVVRRTKEHSPYTHSIPILANKLSSEIPEEIKKKLAGFMEFYLEARYPEERKKILPKVHKGFCADEFKRNQESIRMVEREVTEKLTLFREALAKQGITVSAIILFGSYAAGKFHKDSDIDVAVVSPNFGKDRFKEGVKLFQIACDIDPRIEPIPVSLESYKNDTWIPLIYEIRKKGIEIKTN